MSGPGEEASTAILAADYRIHSVGTREKHASSLYNMVIEVQKLNEGMAKLKRQAEGN